MTKKKLHIKTFGCQMNLYDSDRMVDILEPIGFEMSDEVRDADLVILNTCHIREKAADKVYSMLGKLRKEKERMRVRGKRMTIAVAGCVAQAEGKEILKRAPYVDIVIGPQAYQRLPEMIANAAETEGQGVLDLNFAANDKFDLLPEESRVYNFSSLLTIQEGCDKYCTYCIVPFTRGREFSRPTRDVLREAKRLVEKGAKEMTLLGQNVNAWRDKDAGLGSLIRSLAEIDGLERIRYTTSHPRDLQDELIQAHADVEKLMPYLHLPIQSGSDDVLKRMNRKHDVAFYLKLVDKLRKARPDIALSSDFIVGFPGETDEDFRDTMNLVEEVKYAQAYSFKYSPRLGTSSAVKKNQIPEEVKKERLAELQDLLNKQQTDFNRNSIGKTMSVLFNREGKHDGQMLGASPYMQAVHVTDPVEYGDITKVKITESYERSLGGEVVD